MPLSLSGSTGISGVDGSASIPTVQGSGSNTGLFFPASNTVALSTASTERLRIDSSGNVGIGTTTSLSRLTALGSSSTVTNGASTRNPIASIRGGNDNNRLEMYVDNSGATTIMGFGAYNTAGGATAMAFYTGATVSEAMRIDASGNVGIGTSSPSAKLHVNGNIKAFQGSYVGVARADGSLVSYISNVADNETQWRSDGGGAFSTFYTSGTERMRITSTGAISVGSTGTATGTSGQVLTSAGSGSAPTWTTISTEVTTAPTTTVYTTGSGTYTTPANVKYLYIRMVGGGAGAGGQAGSTGTGGGNTTFGSSFLTAGGGSAPAANAGGASGGTATGGDINIPGGGGGPRCFAAPQVGSPGGHSMLGNGGQFGEANGGGGFSGTGYGAGGGSYGPSSGQNSGGGGGAGGYLEKIVSSPAATYSYAVGAGGNAGTNSGQGTGGIIIIQEYYNY